MKIFLDANIIISILNKEYPLYTHTSRIISLSDKKNFIYFTSAVSLAIAFYFSEKKDGTLRAKKKIELLTSNLSVSKTDEQIVKQALKNKKVHDFEDGIEYYSATESNCTVLVTDDIEDFYFSEIEVLKPEAFIKKYLQ